MKGLLTPLKQITWKFCGKWRLGILWKKILHFPQNFSIHSPWAFSSILYFSSEIIEIIGTKENAIFELYWNNKEHFLWKKALKWKYDVMEMRMIHYYLQYLYTCKTVDVMTLAMALYKEWVETLYTNLYIHYIQQGCA